VLPDYGGFRDGFCRGFCGAVPAADFNGLNGLDGLADSAGPGTQFLE
jgi:hypothetical protein